MTGLFVTERVLTVRARGPRHMALAALPMTGFSVLWFVIAGFALLMAGGELVRIVPRRHA